MNYFLLFVILALCGGGYYEYTLQKESDSNYQRQITDLEARVEKVQSDSVKITEEKTELSKKLADTQVKITDLNSQIAAAAAAAKAVKDAENAAKAAKAAVEAVVVKQAAVVPTNNLGTLSTLDGKTFQNCQLLRVEADGVTFSHSAGITKVLFPLLQPDLQKKFGFNPSIGTSLTDAQVLVQEAQRKAAARAAGN